eukprot:1706729-Pleurochrysis_carterae.AAC.1
MRPTALAFFEQAAASRALGVREEKLTARARRAAFDISRIIRELAAGDATVERLVSAAFSAMAAAKRNHAAEFLPGGIRAAKQINPSCASA